jgi:hypothetical protein
MLFPRFGRMNVNSTHSFTPKPLNGWSSVFGLEHRSISINIKPELTDLGCQIGSPFCIRTNQFHHTDIRNKTKFDGLRFWRKRSSYPTLTPTKTKIFLFPQFRKAPLPLQTCPLGLRPFLGHLVSRFWNPKSKIVPNFHPLPLPPLEDLRYAPISNVFLPYFQNQYNIQLLIFDICQRFLTEL